MGQNNSSENLLAYTRAIAIVPLLFEAILFLFLVYGIVVFLNNLYLYVFLLQIPHLFLLTCLFIGITSPQVFSIVFFSLTTYALATILDILAFLIRFIFSVVVLTSFDYWLFFVVSIALIVNDLIAVAVLMVISCASATVIQTTTSDPSSIDSKTTANMRGRLDFIWIIEIIIVFVLGILVVLDLDVSWKILYVIHLLHLTLWPIERALAHRYSFEMVRNPQIILMYTFLYVALAMVPDVFITVIKLFLLITHFLYGLYLPFLGYVLIVSTVLSALLMILTFLVTWQMLSIYIEEEKILAKKIK